MLLYFWGRSGAGIVFWAVFRVSTPGHVQSSAGCGPAQSAPVHLALSRGFRVETSSY